MLRGCVISHHMSLSLSLEKVWSGLTGELVSNLCRQVQPVYSLSPSPNGE